MLQRMDDFRVKGRAISAILDDVNQIMKERGIEAEDYGFSSSVDHDGLNDRIWPSSKTTNLRWVACFPVQGGSEGCYVHIELIFQHMHGKPLPKQGERRLIGLAKCYSWQNALAMTNVAAEIFEGNDAFKRRDDVWGP